MKIFFKYKTRPLKNNKGLVPLQILQKSFKKLKLLIVDIFCFSKIRKSGKFVMGFTLIELLVVFFIMASILAVVIPGYLEYSTKLDLENLALDVALTIREAQSYGAGSKVSSAGIFDISYGVHFDIKDNPTRFIFYEDTNKNNQYDDSVTDKVITPYDINGGYLINDLCGFKNGVGKECGNGTVRYLDIVFKRPNPDPIMQLRNSITGGVIHGGEQDNAQIELISPDQATTSVSVTSLGAISITGN